MGTNRYVRPWNGGWVVVKEGHRRGADRANTKREAVQRARTLVRNEGGGEVRVMNSAGKLTYADAVAPPSKIKDRVGRAG